MDNVDENRNESCSEFTIWNLYRKVTCVISQELNQNNPCFLVMWLASILFLNALQDIAKALRSNICELNVIRICHEGVKPCLAHTTFLQFLNDRL
jgi:hypothetical protein